MFSAYAPFRQWKIARIRNVFLKRTVVKDSRPTLREAEQGSAVYLCIFHDPRRRSNPHESAAYVSACVGNYDFGQFWEQNYSGLSQKGYIVRTFLNRQQRRPSRRRT